MLDRGDEREIRVFISSPSDVAGERARAAAVLRELSGEFAGRYRLVPVLWEESYYSAHQTFQAAIPKPSSCQLVVCILWKRLGSELPPQFNRPDGTTRTGTEYEFEEALEAALQQELPEILVYRKRVLIDAERIGQEASELRALNAFWQRWFNDEDGNFTASFDRFATEDEFYDKLKRSIRQWLGRLGQQVTWPVAQLGSPFRSLEPFEASHARVFFGRRRVIRQAVSKLAAASARGCPFLLVLGGSGTGKSSLARAGVVPFLMRERALPGVAAWRVATVRPAALGEDPIHGLAEALFLPDALPELGQGEAANPEELAAMMRGAPGTAAAAVAAALDRVSAADGGARLVLLVDQLEELLLRAPEIRSAFIAVLDVLVRAGRVWAIATLRSDRYAEFQAAPRLVRLKADGDTLDLLPPGAAEIREIIEGPATAAGLAFEESGERSLVSLLEAAAQERGALPLLQFTLQTLFDRRDPASGMLLLSEYDRLGGLAGAIAGEAERLVAALPDELRAALPPLLLRLVEFEEGKDAATARTVDQAALTDPAQRDLAQRMVEARLLTADASGTGARLRLAHEALLTQWPRLADLIAEHRTLLAARRRIEADAAAWLAHERHADFLLPSGRRLAEAAEILAGRGSELEPASVEFVEASLAAERERLQAEAEAKRRELEQRAEAAEARAQAARRLVRRTRVAVAVISVALLAMVGAASLWLKQREVAQQRAAEAEANYTIALKAASTNLDIVNHAAAAGRVTFPVKQALLKITREAFENLPTDREAPDATVARIRLLIALEVSNSATDLGRKAVDLAGGLVARDARNPEWQEVLQQAHWQLGTSLVMAGDLKEAANQFAAGEAIASRFAAAQPDDKPWHNRLDSQRKSAAEVMRRRGDLAGALERYRASEDRVGEGDVLFARGDLQGAAAAYREFLNTVTDRAKKNPANSHLEGALAIAHARMGDVLLASGDSDAALSEYQASVKLGRALFQNMQGSFAAARTLFTASRGVADIALAKGDQERALARYQAIAEEAAKRVKNFPKTPEWQAELAEINERIGDVDLAKGDFAAAEAQYRSELAAAAAVVQMVPDDADWQRDLELAHGRLAEALKGKGDLAGAEAEAKAQVDLAGQLVRIDPANVDWQRDLALGWARLGGLLQDRHDAGAEDAFAQCRAVPVKTALDPRDERAHDPRDACRPAGAPT